MVNLFLSIPTSAVGSEEKRLMLFFKGQLSMFVKVFGAERYISSFGGFEFKSESS